MADDEAADDVQTLKVKVGRKHEDLERRRSATLRLEPPGPDPRKTTSFVRARNSGVNRLLRSNTSSNVTQNGHSSTPGSGSSVVKSGSKSAPASKTNSQNAIAESPGVEPVNESTVGASGPPPSPVKSGASAAKPASASSSAPGSGSGADQEADAEEAEMEEEEVLELDDADEDTFPPFLEQNWTHVVLKMTAFSEEDAVTSFRFDVNGGGVGRDSDNVASIPADKLLAAKDHARVLYNGGRFYLVNGENTSGTYVRLGPVGDSGGDNGEPLSHDNTEDRMQWPLEPHVSFRAGKSDFLVTAFHEATQTLEVAALSGKLAGTQFSIGREGAGIGRSADNAIHTGDGELSRKHAAIWFDELTNQFYLVDLNSTNGTFMKLAGSYQEPYRLEIGDDLLVAQTCLTVNRFDFGAHADMGARKHMEDAHTIIQDMCIESLSRLGLHPQSFFAVYDGHGGDEASAYLGDVLHHNIIDTFFLKKSELKPLLGQPTEELQAMIMQRLTGAFERTDEEFLNDSERPQAGSTATTVFVAGNLLFVANVGDSRTVLSRKGTAVRLSNDHKPSRRDEAQRIRDTGGFVIHGRIMGELAVSRAFGDSPFKTFDLPEPPKENTDSKPRSEYDSQELPVNPNEILKGPLVIATPEITVTELTDEDEFLLLASDGLYDVLKDQEAVDFVRKKMVELGDVQRAVEATVEHAIFQQRSMDNVTAVVVMFKEPKDLMK